MRRSRQRIADLEHQVWLLDLQKRVAERRLEYATRECETLAGYLERAVTCVRELRGEQV